MYIDLKCSACDVVAPTSYRSLYAIWKAGYDDISEEQKSKISLTAEIKCECGHTETYRSPMFKYTFGVIFQELMSLSD